MNSKSKGRMVKTFDNNENIEKQLRDLVIVRLSAIPKNLQVAIGSNSYTVEELVKSVKNNDNIGKQMVAMQIQYLKDLASGKIYKEFDAQQ
jgi:hypothetical protein